VEAASASDRLAAKLADLAASLEGDERTMLHDVVHLAGTKRDTDEPSDAVLIAALVDVHTHIHEVEAPI
jgi:hypothetical protein